MSAPTADAPAGPDGESGASADPGPAGDRGAAGDPGGRDRRVGVVGAAAALLFGAALSIAGPHPAAVLAVVAAIQLIGVLGAVLFLNLPGRVGGVVLGCAGAVAADLSLWHWTTDELAPLLPVLALAIPLMFVHQLTRGAARVRLVESLSFIAVLAMSVVTLGCWLPLAQQDGGGGLTRGAAAAVGVAVAAAAAVDGFARGPRVDDAAAPTVAGLVAGALLGAVAGAVVLHRSGGLEWLTGAVVAAALGLVAVLVHLGTSFALGDGGPVPLTRPVLRVAAVFALAAPVAFVLCVAAA